MTFKIIDNSVVRQTTVYFSAVYFYRCRYHTNTVSYLCSM